MHHEQLPEVAVEHLLKGVGQAFFYIDRPRIGGHHGANQRQLRIETNRDHASDDVTLADDADKRAALLDRERANVMLAQTTAYLGDHRSNVDGVKGPTTYQ